MRYIRGVGFKPYRPRLKISDEELEAMRLIHYGSTGRPRKGTENGGQRAIAKKLGCSQKTVSRRLMEAAARHDEDLI